MTTELTDRDIVIIRALSNAEELTRDQIHEKTGLRHPEIILSLVWLESKGVVTNRYMQDGRWAYRLVGRGPQIGNHFERPQ